MYGPIFPKITLYSSIIVGVSNVILSFLLAVIFDFGIQGIAVASSISFLISALYSTKVLLNKKQQDDSLDVLFNKNEVSNKFFYVGFYIFIRSMFLTIFMAYLRNRASLMSMEEIALQHVLLQLWSFGYVFVDALAIAAQTLVSEYKTKFHDYRNSDLKIYLNKLTLRISASLFVFSSIFLDTLITLITDKSLGQLIDFELRILFGLSLLIGSFAFLWDGVLLGLDKSREFSSLTVVSSIVGFVSCSYLLNFENSLSSLWIGLNLSLVYRGIVGFLYQIRD